MNLRRSIAASFAVFFGLFAFGNISINEELAAFVAMFFCSVFVSLACYDPKP